MFRRTKTRSDPKAELKAEKRARKSAKDARAPARLQAVEGFFRDPRLVEEFREEPFVLIDGGARGGLQKEWHPLMPLLRAIAIEPRWAPDILARTPVAGDSHVAPLTTRVPRALGGASGVRSLYVTRGGSMSSFLRPDVERVARYGMDYDAEIVDVFPVETTTLDAVVADQDLRFVDFIKLDTQGAELEVLSGGVRTLETVAFGLRVEALFSLLYEEQPLFADIDAFVRPFDFELVDLVHPKRFRRDGPAVRRPDGVQRSNDIFRGGGQLISMDALYFRSPSAVTAHLETVAAVERRRYLAGALLACITYDHDDYAAELLRVSAALMDPSELQTLEDLLRAYVAATE